MIPPTLPPPMLMQFPPFQIEEADYRAGIIAVAAKSPSGRIVPLNISKDNAGQFTTNFVPNEIGDWSISITSNGRHIKGSPFTVRVYDGTKVKVFGIEGGENGLPVSFTVDTAKAGNGKLKVEVTKEGKPITPNVSQYGKQYKITFNPDGPGIYSVRVFYATVEVPGSPFKVTIVDSSNVTASGEGLQSCLVGRATSFTINTGRAVMTDGEVTVNITAPSGVPTPAYAKPIGAGSYNVSYVPEEVGRYAIQVNYGGKPISGSPFVVDVFGLNDVSVISLTKQIVVNKTAVLEFEAKNCGNAEPVVKVNEGKVPCDLKKLDGRKYRVSFTPRKTGHHYIEVKLYNEEIPGSPFKVKVHDGSRVATSLDGARGIVRLPLKFEVNTAPYKGEIKVLVYSPTRKVVQCKIIKMDDQLFHCEFLPSEIGNYDVSITFEDHQIEGSPFLVPVSNPGGVIVSMKSRSLVLGQTFHLTADTTKAGPGDLSVRASNASGPLPMEGSLIGAGLYAVSFVPQVPGQYFIEISFDCRPLPESPVILTVYDVRNVILSAGNSPLSPVGQCRSIHVSTEHAGNAELQAKLTAPGQHATPLQITGTSQTGYDISFVPRDPGPHRIDVTYGGVVVPHSPVMFMAYDASKIKVIGVSDGVVSKRSQFLIDLNDSGEGELEVVVMSSNGKPIMNEVNALQPGKLEVSYVPMEGGMHFVEVTFNKEMVQGSPFKFKVSDPNRIQIRGDGIETVQVNHPALFYIVANEVKVSDFDVHIRGPPKSRQVNPLVSESGNNQLKVEYTTKNVGEYQINISYLGVPIPNSPFYVKSWDASKVVLSKVGQGQVGLESTFNVEMKDAGDGTVEISIVDPTGQLIPNQVSSKCPGVLQVKYVPQVAGTHNIMVEFNDVKINGTPMQFQVVDPSMVTVKGEGLSVVPCHSPTTFIVSAPDAQLKDVDVKITGPAGQDVPFNCNERGGSFRFDYTPKMAGDYMIEVCLYKTPVKGNPFTSKAFDTTKVMIANVGMGQVGSKNMFKVVVAEAGEGVCEISITDPNGQLVPNQVVPAEPGVLDVIYIPSTHGPHRGVVLFNHQNVPGSPFNFLVIDKSKVTCKSNNSGYVPIKTLTNVLLTAPLAEMKDIEVKVIGPKDMEIMSDVFNAGSYSYRVDFTPPVAGDYHIAVKYFDHPIHVCTVKAWDISRVLVGNIGIGRVGNENIFNVDVKDAGEGKLEISIQNPSNQMIENVVTPVSKTPGLYHVSCIPLVTGIHKVHVQFNGENANGSPFQMVVCDPKQVTVSGEGLGIVRCNRPTWFEINGPGALLADVHISIKSPTRRELKPKIKDKGCGRFVVEYIPEEPGEHLISVKYFDEPVQNSPFISTAWNLGYVTVDCIKPGIIGRPNTFHINAGQAGPGNLEVMITCNGEVIKNTARAVPNTGLVEVTYTPTSFEPYLINIKYNGELVNGSPFTANVLNGNLARATGPGLGRVRAGIPTKFNVIASAVGCQAEVEVLITSPSGQIVPTAVSGNYASGYLVEYIPLESGQHLASVKYADMDIKDSPFHPDVYDPTQVLVSNIPIGCVNKNVSFKVDSSAAGSGKLQATVQGIKTRPFPEISTDGNNVSLISFTPTEGGVHNITLKFNDFDVPGSPFKCSVVDQKMIKVKLDSVSLRPVGKPVLLQLDTQELPELPVTANVSDPNGNPVIIMEERTGSIYTLQFLPEVVGTYMIYLVYGCDVVPGSPFTCSIYDPCLVRILDVTPNGTMGQEISFLVDTTDAGPGPIDVNILCNGNVVPTKKDKYLDKYRFTFCARSPCDYLIDVHFNKQQVPGTPFTYKITNPASNMNLVSGNDGKPVGVGQLVWAVVTPPPDIRISACDCQAEVIGPYDDKVIPSKVSNLSNGNIKIEYTSTICGPHAINVAYGGQLVPGSPVINNIFDPNSITIEGVKYGEVNKPMMVDVIKNSCGQAELGVSVINPENIDFPFTMEEIDSGERVIYVPNQPGIYKINVTYGGLNVPGCPVRQEIKAYYPATASGDGLFNGCVGKPATFFVDTKKQKGELVVQIQSPSGGVKSHITPELNGNFKVDYTPTEAGIYSVNMTFRKKEIPGPFNPKISDPSQVRIVDNWEFWPQEDHVIVPVNQLKTIGFNTEMAGPGELTAQIETPDANTSISPDLLPTEGGYLLKFIPKSFGNHVIRVYYNKCPTRIFPVIAICNPEKVDIVVDIPPQPNTCSTDCTCEKETVQKEAVQKEALQKNRCKCNKGRNGSPYPSPLSSEDEDDIIIAKKESKVGDAPPTTKIVTFDDAPKTIETPESVVETPMNTYILEPNFVPVNDLQFMQTQFTAPQFMAPQFMGPQFITPQFVDGQYSMGQPITQMGPPQFIMQQQQPQIDVQNVDATYLPPQIQPVIIEETVQEVDDEPTPAVKPNYPYEVNACKINGNICSNPETQQVFLVPCDPPPPKKETSNTSVQTMSIDSVETQTDVVEAPPQPPALMPFIYEDYQVELSCPEHQYQPPCPTCPTCNQCPPQYIFPPLPPKTTSTSSAQTAPEHSTGGTQTDTPEPDKIVEVIQIMEPVPKPEPPKCCPPQQLLVMSSDCPDGQPQFYALPQSYHDSNSQCCPSNPQLLVFPHPPPPPPPQEPPLMVHQEFFQIDSNIPQPAPPQPAPALPPPVEPPPAPIKMQSTASSQTAPMTNDGGIQTDPVPDQIEYVPLFPVIQEEEIVLQPQPPPPPPPPQPKLVFVPQQPDVFVLPCNNEQNIQTVPKQTDDSVVMVPCDPNQPIPQHLTSEDGQYILVPFNPYPPTVLQEVCPAPPLPQPNLDLSSFNARHEEFNNYMSTQVIEPPEVFHHIIIDPPPCESPKKSDSDNMLELVKLLNEMNKPKDPEPPPPPCPEPPKIDENKVVLCGPGLSIARCREQICFVIDGKLAGPGKPKARLTGLKEEIPVDIELVDENLYGCSYVPTVPGAYLLTVWWNDRQVPGSPIKITVLPCCDPKQVSLYTDCLKCAQIGQDVSAVVDCRRAGCGNLTAYVQGPGRLYHCEIDNRNDGTYEVTFKPQEVGNYVLNVMYDGENVPDSPFSFKVGASPDASKVKVSGEGIKNGILATFDSKFTVDTRGAGPGQLNVKVRGKKGTFQVEMKRDPNRDRVILCQFNPTEVGEYWVNVLWSGEHAPGSPFKVVIVDTLQEMRALKSGVKQASANMFYGSMSSEPGAKFNFGGDDF